MNALSLVLKGEWYDKIQRGEKTHEYRELKPYWIKRLTDRMYGGDELAMLKRGAIGMPESAWKKYDRVLLRRGYTNKLMIFKIKRISITKTAQNDLGEICIDIHLGERIQ